MHCWLTVHHPPEIGAPVTNELTGIWVPLPRKRASEALAVGDRVAIYQTKDGPARWLTFPNGTKRRSRYLPGRGGVVAVGEIIEDHAAPPITIAEHDNGNRFEWGRLATVRIRSGAGFVSRAELNGLLGYHPDARIRGHGGLRRVPDDAFAQIEQRFGVAPG